MYTDSHTTSATFPPLSLHVLFAPEKVNYQSLGVLVTTPFRIWTSKSSALHRHNKSQYHQDSMVKMDSFKYTSTNSSASLTSRLSKEREERIKCNTEVIKSLRMCDIFGKARITISRS